MGLGSHDHVPGSNWTRDEDSLHAATSHERTVSDDRLARCRPCRRVRITRGTQSNVEAIPGYRGPIEALIRRHWHPTHEADDRAQDFFTRLLEKDTLARANRERGRFRDFLREVCLNFLSDKDRSRRAKKNGGDASIVSTDVRDEEGNYINEPVDMMTPDRDYDQDCALVVLRQALGRLAQEYSKTEDRAKVFAYLKEILTDGREDFPSDDVAETLGMTKNNLDQKVCLLRKRFREILREEVAKTLFDRSQVDEELRLLFDAFHA